MGEIVNLRMARKRAARAAHEAESEANRALHSVPGRERKLAKSERERLGKRLEGNRLAGRDERTD